MIFRQLFDCASCSYSYLLANCRGGEALIIDPVLEKVDRYLRLFAELDVRLAKAVDTHLHADHITGLGALRDQTGALLGSYADLADALSPGGMLSEFTRATSKRLVFYCAFGERSAMAVQVAQDAGITSAIHIEGGIAAWRQVAGPTKF
jgi:glyoxylase-like metal-dependent hydrolase (beta-lactamase superfamily II)